MKRLILLVLAIALVGCSKQNVPQSTESPYSGIVSISFTDYDSDIIVSLESGESIKSMDQYSAVLNHKGDEIHIDYIEGNSLNDYVEAYYNAIPGGKSKLSNNTFQTENTFYAFYKSDNNVYLMVSAPIRVKERCEEIIENLQGR